jgi:PelA/Pel-15E family pectate lyase
MAVKMLALIVLLAPVAAVAAGAKDYLKRPDAWFRSDEGRKVAANILSHQSTQGSWPKNQDNATVPSTIPAEQIKGTFDNGATTDEMRFLARAMKADPQSSYQTAFFKGLDHILKAQYANGGWPQYYPSSKGYPRYVTYNDNAMVRLMELVRETADLTFVDEARKKQAREAFDRGIACILKSQVKVNGKLTAWCAQHDEVDLSPKPARAFEPVSLSGHETVGLVRLLMSLDRPSPEVFRAVESAVAWLEAVRLKGIRQVSEDGDKKVVQDANAPPLWARFYEIGTNRVLYGDRDGKVYFSLAEISKERRTGYAWHGTWPENLLTREHPGWKRKWAP